MRLSVTVVNSETRPVLAFPDIPGFTKRGISTNVIPADGNEKNNANQVITQHYQALTAGRFVEHQLEALRVGGGLDAAVAGGARVVSRELELQVIDELPGRDGEALVQAIGAQ